MYNYVVVIEGQSFLTSLNSSSRRQDLCETKIGICPNEMGR